MEDNPAEVRFARAVQNMIARADYLLPLVAADRQFRKHYYGLNSAALLEDLFFDALANYLRQYEPELSMSRPRTGEKGWDYAFDGVRFSHKVSRKLDVISVLWDATIQMDTWSADEPVVYALGETSAIKVHQNGTSRRATLLGAHEQERPIPKGTLLIVQWGERGSGPKLLEEFTAAGDSTIPDTLPFETIWAHLAKHVRAGGQANEIEVLHLAGQRQSNSLLETDNLEFDVESGLRAGIYILSPKMLQNVSVTRNNRGILIPKKTVQEVLADAEFHNLFVPMPTWFAAYSEARPPDMYAAQRAEYDALFSARAIKRT